MDRKMVATIIVMLIASIVIMSGAILLPETPEKEISSTFPERFFDKNRVIDIYINVAEQDFADMMENPTKEEYKHASVVVDGEAVENIGFRVKGNSSLNMVASTDSERFSFKLDFDQYINGQSLAGLTKLNLNNSVSDPSYMREYLSYSLLNQMGVPTPVYSYANVYVNGNLAGLYLAVEGLEEPFLERQFGSNYGALYKPEGQGSDLIYVNEQRESYSGIALVTKPKKGDDAALLQMIKALNEGKNLEQYLDVDGILRYFAVNTVLVNMDSYQGNMKHNYYLYEKDGIFTILPWDYNMSFGGFNMGAGGQNLTSLYIDQPVSGTTLTQRPLIGKLLEVAEYKDLYHQYIAEFIHGPFALEQISKEIERVANLIRPYLEKDPTKFYSMEQFEQAIKAGSVSQKNPVEESLPSTETRGGRQQGGNRMMMGDNVIGLGTFIQERLLNVKRQLSGEIPSKGDVTENTSVPGNFRWNSQGNLQGDQPAGRWPGQGGQFPPEGMGQLPPGMDQFPEGMVRELPEGMDAMRKNRMVQQGDSSQQIVLVCTAIVMLLIAIVLVFRKRTKYFV